MTAPRGAWLVLAGACALGAALVLLDPLSPHPKPVSSPSPSPVPIFKELDRDFIRSGTRALVSAYGENFGTSADGVSVTMSQVSCSIVGVEPRRITFFTPWGLSDLVKLEVKITVRGRVFESSLEVVKDERKCVVKRPPPR